MEHSKTDITDCFWTLDKNNFIIHFSLSMIALAINICCFYLFYFNENRKRKGSILPDYIMITYLLHAGINYTVIIMTLASLDTDNELLYPVIEVCANIISFSKVDFSGDILHQFEAMLLLYAIIFFLLNEMFYSLETTQVVRNPVTNFSRRGKIYNFFSFLYWVTLALWACFILSKHKFKISLLIVFFCFSALYTLINIFSFFLIVKILLTKNKIIRPNFKRFALRHFLYLIIVLPGMIYPEMVFAKIFKEEQSKNDDVQKNCIDKNHIDIAIYIITSIGILIGLIRLFELDFSDVQEKNDEKNENLDSNQLKENQDENQETKEVELCANLVGEKEEKSHNFLANISRKSQNRTSITSKIQSGFITECFRYTLELILHISKREPLIMENDNDYGIPINYIMNLEYDETNIFNDFTIIKFEKTSKESWYKSLSRIFRSQRNIIEYCPKSFQAIRNVGQVTPQDLQDSFDIDKNRKGLNKFSDSEGKSGSLFFRTYDKKFLIKTISDDEISALENNVIPEINNHYLQNNKSLLSKLYGLYTLFIGLSKVNLIVMENITPLKKKVFNYKFDLKGSKVGRKTIINSKNINTTKKEADFEELKKSIELDYGLRNQIIRTIENDLELLEKCNLMDYSLFLTISETVNIPKDYKNPKAFKSIDGKITYHLGIIDYLTQYNFKKKMENAYLNVTKFNKRNEVSAVSAPAFRKRFYDYMSRHVTRTKIKN